MPNELGLLRDRVNRRVQLLAILMIILGLAMLYLSKPIYEACWRRSGTLLAESGAAIFIAAVLFLLWELGGKRAFADEILAKANMARDLADAGLTTVRDNFKDERINWAELFKNACQLDIFIAYGQTWRNTQSERIASFLSDAHSQLRIVLPDPEDSHVVQSLAIRFGNTKPEDIQRMIQESKDFFQNRQDKAKGNVEIYLSGVVPLLTFYRFNNRVVWALYNHREEKSTVPAFICSDEGFLFEYFTDEFKGILANGRTRRVDRKFLDQQRQRVEPPKPAGRSEDSL